MFSPGGGSQPPACLPRSRPPSSSASVRSLFLHSFTPSSIQALRVKGEPEPGSAEEPSSAALGGAAPSAGGSA